MIVRVALVTMRRAMAVTMIMVAVPVMVVIMPATTALAMRMVVLMRMIVMAVMVLMAVIVTMMVVMVVVMMVVAAAAVVAMSVVVHLRLRLERTLDRRHRTALPAHQLGQRRIVRHIESVGRHLGRNVMAAEMPGETRQPQRVLGTHLQKAFRHGLDLHEAAVLQLQRIAVVQRRRLVERDLDLEPACGRSGHAAAIAVVMGEAKRVDDALGADSGLAKNGRSAKHMRRSHA